MRRIVAPLLLAVAATACGTDSANAPINADENPVLVRRLADPPTGPLPDTCHSAYWPCVPRARDVDCLGRGDGPVLMEGPIDVITHDPYGLDDDRDGTGCEP